MKGDNFSSKSVEDRIGDLLLKKDLTIAVAESLTGGQVSAKLISYPGISKSYLEGFICYSNESKLVRLNVRGETLEKYGAVSKETAKEMAYGVAMVAGTDIGLSTTGVAGPSGGSKDKPVGLAYVCLFYGGKYRVEEIHAKGDREAIRGEVTMAALNLLWACIKD